VPQARDPARHPTLRRPPGLPPVRLPLARPLQHPPQAQEQRPAQPRRLRNTTLSYTHTRRISIQTGVHLSGGTPDCAACPLRAKCPPATTGKGGRALPPLPREQQEVLAKRREEQQTEEWKKRYDIRAGAEGTIPQAVRRPGIRRTRYTGLSKT